MRRTSFVAPLLLIALGALLLARTLYPELQLMDYIARYWPVILIGWGVLRIVEILAWSASSKPLPARGLSGGEWVLIVFLCLFGVSLHTVQGFSNWWPDHVQFDGLDLFDGERYEYPLSGEKASSRSAACADRRFSRRCENQRRRFRLGADMVKVTGHKTIRGLGQKEADKSNDTSPLEITGDANNVVIRLQSGADAEFGRVSATLEINVPKGSSVEVHGRNGDLEINDITGVRRDHVG